MKTISRYISGLTISQGEGEGKSFCLLPWERRFINGAFNKKVSTAALTLGRGNGKTTLSASIASATVDGPIVKSRAETVIVASSFGQAKITFEHVLGFLRPVLDRDGTGKHGRFRVQDTTNQASIQDRKTGARVRCIGSDPKRAHGLAPSLLLLDEPGQWEASKSEKMISALKTSLGKIPGSRLIALGTKPADSGHWFCRMLDGGADYVQVHAARQGDPKFQKRTWMRANPSLSIMPALLEVIEKEAKEAKRDPLSLASFESLRLNLGTSDTAQSVLLRPEDWSRAEGEGETRGRYSLGLDLGQNAAMSGASAFFIESGYLDGFCVFPELPSLQKRGLADGVGRLYVDLAREGDLMIAGKRVSDIRALLGECLSRWGKPESVSCDRWRRAELEQELEAVRFPQVPLICRGQGFKDGAEDVRVFRRALLDGQVTPKRSLLFRSAMSEARTITDVAGNSKLAKRCEGGRRGNARDDLAAAAILAVSEGIRRKQKQAPAFRYVGAC